MKYTKPRKHLSHFFFALGICGIFIAALANSPAPARAALMPPAPAYDGFVDRADCSFIGGYALDDNNSDVTINIDIYDGPNLIATVPANRFRRDLYDGGMTNPNHGFLFSLPASVKDGQIHRIFVNFGGTFLGLSGSPIDLACKASLFPTATPDTTASDPQGQTWEQGVEFSSSMSGIIRQVRFWRAAEEPPGGHTANIWSTSGTRLTSAQFNETSNPGWQYATVNFPITAGVRYRVTYNLNYVVAKTFFVFNNGPITKGPLTAWGSYYGTPAGKFPTSGSTSNLFADIVFDAPR